MSNTKRNYPNFLQLFLSLPFMGILLMVGFIVVLGGIEPSIEEISSKSLFLSYSLGFGSVLLLLYFLSARRPIRWLGWDGVGIGIIALLSILFIPARLPIVQLIPVSEELIEQFENLIIFDLWGFLTICIAAALLEELIFRGVILEGLLRNYNKWLAITVSSIIFGLAHLNPVQFISAALLGVFIGWLYSRTRSVLPGIMVHFINNSVPFILGWYADRAPSFSLEQSQPDYKYILLGGMVCALVSVPLIRTLHKMLPKNTINEEIFDTLDDGMNKNLTAEA